MQYSAILWILSRFSFHNDKQTSVFSPVLIVLHIAIFKLNGIQFRLKHSIYNKLCKNFKFKFLFLFVSVFHSNLANWSGQVGTLLDLRSYSCVQIYFSILSSFVMVSSIEWSACYCALSMREIYCPVNQLFIGCMGPSCLARALTINVVYPISQTNNIMAIARFGQ